MKAPGDGAGKRRVWGRPVFWRNDPKKARAAAAAAAAAAAVIAAKVLAARRKRAAEDAEDISRWETNGGQ